MGTDLAIKKLFTFLPIMIRSKFSLTSCFFTKNLPVFLVSFLNKKMSRMKFVVSHNAECIVWDGFEWCVNVACSDINTHELMVKKLREGNRTLKYYCHEYSERIKIIAKFLKNYLEDLSLY